jgi:lipopolysaccharide biosynthesis glycosyltransferase
VSYAETETVFCGDLIGADQIELGDNLLAARREDGEYFNAGFLIMNLKAMREENIYPQFVKLSKQKFEFLDQDILNITCRNKNIVLPLKYNFMTYRFYDDLKLNHYRKEELEGLKNGLVMLHYAVPSCKPWKSKYALYAGVWKWYERRLLGMPVPTQATSRAPLGGKTGRPAISA